MSATTNEPVPGAQLPRLVLLGFGLGSLATGIYSTVPGLLLQFFMVTTLGVPAILAGVATFLPKFWVIIADPLTGRFSDRTESRWGRRRPYLLVGAVTSSFLMIALFAVPTFSSPVGNFAYICIAYLLASTAYGVFAVPYVALPSEMTRSPRELTRMMSWRMSFMLIGVLLSGALAPQLIASAGGGRRGYVVMGVVLALVCGLAMLITFIAAAWAPSLPPIDAYLQKPGALRGALLNRSFRTLLMTYVLQLTGVGCMTAMLPYYAVFVDGAGANSVSLMFLFLTGTAIAAMPIWTSISRHTSRRLAYAIAILTMAAALLSIAVAGARVTAPVLYGAMAMVGFGFAGIQLFPFTMLPDIVQAHADRTGNQIQGLFTGLWTASEKVALAAGSLVGGAVLAVFGFAESSTVAVAQSTLALQGVRIGFSIVPAALLVLSLPLLKRYRETD